MPWGWECRQRLVPQRPPNPAVRRGIVSAEQGCPGPQAITLPPIIGGNGYSHVKRAPAYTFGHMTPAEIKKPATDPKARLLSVQGLRSQGGKFRVPGGLIEAPAHDPRTSALPGPAQYTPTTRFTRPAPPRYSLRPAAPPPYESPVCWTPGANMYNPAGYDRMGSGPAFNILPPPKETKPANVPGPGAYNYNYKYVKVTVPEFSIGCPLPRPHPKRHVPPPNAHCNKLFKSVLPTAPAPTFGIRHSQFIPFPPLYPVPQKN